MEGNNSQVLPEQNQPLPEQPAGQVSEPVASQPLDPATVQQSDQERVKPPFPPAPFPSQSGQGKKTAESAAPPPQNKLLKILPFLFLMLLFAALGAFGFWYYQENMVKGDEEEIAVAASPLAESSPDLPMATPSASLPASPLLAEKEAPDNWDLYINTKHKYSFRYPGDVELKSQTQTGGGIVEDDYVVIEAKEDEDSQRGFFLRVQVASPETSHFSPPLGTEVVAWLKEKFAGIHADIPDQVNSAINGFPAVKIYTRSPQAGAQMDVYVIKGARLFHFNMLDIDSAGAETFYNLFLSTFKFQ